MLEWKGVCHTLRAVTNTVSHVTCSTLGGLEDDFDGGSDGGSEVAEFQVDPRGLKESTGLESPVRMPGGKQLPAGPSGGTSIVEELDNEVRLLFLFVCVAGDQQGGQDSIVSSCGAVDRQGSKFKGRKRSSTSLGEM